MTVLCLYGVKSRTVPMAPSMIVQKFSRILKTGEEPNTQTCLVYQILLSTGREKLLLCWGRVNPSPGMGLERSATMDQQWESHTETPSEDIWRLYTERLRLLQLLRYILRHSSAAGRPNDWVGYNGICYFLSKDHCCWDQAQARCSELRASLAVLKDWEMEFFFCLSKNDDYWLGLHRQGQRLQWVDGSNFNSSVPLLGNAGCVFLADNMLRSGSCSNEMQYICRRPQTRL